MINRALLLEGVRSPLFQGKVLLINQRLGIEAICSAWDHLYPKADLRWIAYSLATAHHETGFTFKPLKEWGRGKGKKYGVADKQTGQIYYGRGFVQLTWKFNYEKMGKRLGFDLVSNPDRAMDPIVAAQIIVVGMVEGSFTGRGLARYITPKACDYLNARRIINGTDKASAIAAYAKKFEACLQRSIYKGEDLVADAKPAQPEIGPAIAAIPQAPASPLPVAPVAQPPVSTAVNASIISTASNEVAKSDVAIPTEKLGFFARLKARFA